MQDSIDPQISDEECLARFARAKDREAAARLAERHQTPVYDLSLRILRDPNDAADATQATFLAVLRGAAGFAGRASFRTWLYRIAVREAWRIQSQRKRSEESRTPMEPNEIPNPPAGDDRARTIAALEDELGSLPEHERIAVVLHYLRGLSYDETAEALGCASGTVGSRLASARERLRVRLGSLGLAAAVPDVESWLRAARPSPAPAGVRAAVAKIAASASPAAGIGALSTAAAWCLAAGLAAAAVTAMAVVEGSGGPEPRTLASAGGSQGNGAGAGPSTQPAAEPGARVAATPAGRDPKATDPKANDLEARAPFRLSGRVVDGASGRPIAGARVALERVWPPDPTIRQTKLAPGKAARTDSKGRYRIEYASEGPALYRAQVDWNDFGGLLPEPPSPEPPPSSAPEAAGGGALNAKDVRGLAPVHLLEAETGRDETLDFTVAKSDPKEAEALHAAARAAQVPAFRKVLSREKLASVSGRVQRDDGKPLSRDTHLSVFDAEGFLDLSTPLFAFDLATGEFCVGPLPEGIARIEVTTPEDGYAVAPQVPVRAGGPTENLVLTLHRGSASARGIVVNREGEPVAGARIEAFPDALLESEMWIPPAASAASAKDGSFSLEKVGNPGEALRIRVFAEGYRAELLRGASAGDANLRVVVKRHARLTGRIVLKGTEKAPPRVGQFSFGAAVYISPKDPPKSKTNMKAQTMVPTVDLAPDGKFTTRANPGPSIVRIEMEGYATVTKEVTIADDGADLGLVELEPVKRR